MKNISSFMKKRYLSLLTLASILCIAAFFRFYDINWDSGFHLHPDERFLVMVGNAMKMPESPIQYLDPQTSPLNPTNIGYKFYVYGTFPVVLNKLLAIAFSTDTYQDFLIQGRLLSGFFDLLTILYIFKLLLLFKKHRNLPKEIVYLGPIFYAIAVMPIQLSHFFTVDTFLNCFLFASLYYVLTFYFEKNIWRLLAGSFFFALAVASKISAVFMLPLLLFILLLGETRNHSLATFIAKPLLQKPHIKDRLLKAIGSFALVTMVFLLATYLVLRLAEPYYFADANLLNPRPNPVFMENIASLKSFSTKDVWYPPSVQWINKLPVIFSIYNLAFFGVGLFYFLLIPIGTFFLLKKHHTLEIVALFGWGILFFLYQSMQFSQTMRYFIVLYPFFAFAAAAGFYYTFYKLKRFAKICVFILILSWPLCFISIYIKPMTRVEASHWISHNIPQGSYIFGELWDDALPLPLPDNHYAIDLLPVFDPDTPEKWEKMNELLEKGDYYILSSNRAWGSMSTVPERYPQMTKFYKDLFAGKLAYKKIKEFSSYPSLTYLGIPITIPDTTSDESFTVYDHPQVMIFKRN